MKRLKLCVVGHRRHGKDTVCQLLEQLFNITFMSSSYYCCQKFIFEQTKDVYGYNTVDECFEDRHDKPADWFERIKNYIKEDQTKLARQILEQHNVYCGMCNGFELNATRNLFDAVIWVDAKHRLPQEHSNSMTIVEEDTHCTIDNNGSEHELARIVDMCYQTLSDKLDIVKASSHLESRFIFR